MLPDKNITTEAQKQNEKFVTVIHPKKLTAIATKEKTTTLIDRESLVSWLFLIGSFLFLVDGLIELSEGISIRALLYFSASILFVIGSFLFIPTEKKS